MESDFLVATIINLAVNLLYTITALFMGIVSLIIIDKKLLKEIDIQAEMKKGNLSVSIFVSTILLFIALIVTFGLRG